MTSGPPREGITVADMAHSGYVHGAIVAVLTLFFTILLQLRGLLPANPLVTLAGGVLGFGIGTGVARALLGAGARAAGSVYAPAGNSNSYTPTLSHIEALEARGDLDGAAEAWEIEIHEHPESAALLARAADFHLRLRKDPAAALSHYQRARALGTGTTDLRRYVQQKLVDLYLGPLNDEGRAMAELRRLIDAFPGTREAEAARVSLAELKAGRQA
jgi:hypothetical protein